MRVFRIFVSLVVWWGLSSSHAQDLLDPGPWKKLVDSLYSSMEPVDQLANLSVPLLQPAKPVSKWGKPQFYRAKDGGYWLIYSNPDPKKPFERVIVLGTPKPIPSLAAVPDEEVAAEVEGDLGVIRKPQAGKTLAVKWKTPEGPKSLTLRFFRESSGGGADGPLDTTDAFSLSSGGKTGYYVISVESISGETEKRLKGLEVVK